MSKPKLVISGLVVVLLIYTVYMFVNSLDEPTHVHSRDDAPRTEESASVDNNQNTGQLEQQLQDRPDDFVLLMTLGHAYLDQENFESAQEVFRRAVEVNPQSAEAWTDLAIVLKMNGFVDKALANLQKVTKDFPDYAEGWLQLGVIYRFDKEENEKALASFQKFIELERNSELVPRVQQEIQKIQAELNQ